MAAVGRRSRGGRREQAALGTVVCVENTAWGSARCVGGHGRRPAPAARTRRGFPARAEQVGTWCRRWSAPRTHTHTPSTLRQCAGWQVGGKAWPRGGAGRAAGQGATTANNRTQIRRRGHPQRQRWAFEADGGAWPLRRTDTPPTYRWKNVCLAAELWNPRQPLAWRPYNGAPIRQPPKAGFECCWMTVGSTNQSKCT